MTWRLVPRKRFMEIEADIPTGEIHEAVLSFSGLGLSPGCNLSITVEDGAGGSIWSSACTTPLATMRKNSVKALVISLLRSFSVGLVAECVVRRLFSAEMPTYFYELPAPLLQRGPCVTIKIKRLLVLPVLIGDIKLMTGDISPMEMVDTPDDVAAYAGEISVVPGGEVTLRAHTQAKSANLRIVRYGFPVSEHVAECRFQSGRRCRPRAGFRYPADYPIVWRGHIPADAPPGLYGLRITADNGGEQTVPLIVRAKRPKAPVLVVASTNTWVAYNTWGGASAYHWHAEQALGRCRSQLLTASRPNPAADPDRGENHLARGLVALVTWLDREGIFYDIISDSDLHAEPSILHEYRCVLFDCHPEYWSTSMRDGLQAYIAGRGKVVYLGGNGFYWRVEPHGDVYEFVKPSGVFSDGTAGGTWIDLGRPESADVGVAYTPRGAGTFAPFEVLDPHHWVFEGCGLQRGDILGASGDFGAASGHETDKMDRFTPQDVRLLARGLNSRGGGGIDRR